jgi:ssDNA thymidine ADP-ribosyltransferase DarT-like protein
LALPLFTDQHAFVKTANYFTRPGRLDAGGRRLLNSKNFSHDPDDPGKKDRYQAEALVWKHVALKALPGICSYTAEVDAWVKMISPWSPTDNIFLEKR